MHATLTSTPLASTHRPHTPSSSGTVHRQCAVVYHHTLPRRPLIPIASYLLLSREAHTSAATDTQPSLITHEKATELESAVWMVCGVGLSGIFLFVAYTLFTKSQLDVTLRRYDRTSVHHCSPSLRALSPYADSLSPLKKTRSHHVSLKFIGIESVQNGECHLAESTIAPSLTDRPPLSLRYPHQVRGGLFRRHA